MPSWEVIYAHAPACAAAATSRTGLLSSEIDAILVVPRYLLCTAMFSSSIAHPTTYYVNKRIRTERASARQPLAAHPRMRP